IDTLLPQSHDRSSAPATGRHGQNAAAELARPTRPQGCTATPYAIRFCPRTRSFSHYPPAHPVDAHVFRQVTKQRRMTNLRVNVLQPTLANREPEPTALAHNHSRGQRHHLA